MQVSQTALVLLAGVLVIAATTFRPLFDRAGIPTLVGFIVLGFLVRIVDGRIPFLDDASFAVLDFLASLGIICLLFRVGLESHIGQLMKQLSRAGRIWVSDVAVSGLFGFGVAFFVLHLALVTSLFVAVALTATSVGVTVAVWRDARLLDTDTGALLVDVAEMDDVSAVVLIALLGAMTTGLLAAPGSGLAGTALWTLGRLVLEGIAFAGLCYLFAHYVERHVTAFTRRIGGTGAITLTVIGVGLLIAAITDMLGFSFAIGAFFAGLLFSRDPDRVRIDTSFTTIHDFLVPFFFVHIGLAIDPAVLHVALGPAMLILVAAILGKFIGAGMASAPVVGLGAATAIGVGMGARAEIAMLVMDRGRRMGESVVPAEIYDSVVVVGLVTCLVLPIATRFLMSAMRDRITAGAQPAAAGASSGGRAG